MCNMNYVTRKLLKEKNGGREKGKQKIRKESHFLGNSMEQIIARLFTCINFCNVHDKHKIGFAIFEFIQKEIES